MYFGSPIMYDEVIRKIPFGKILTIEAIRNYFARKNGADFTDLMTVGIFVSIVAWASHQRQKDKIAYWRVLKAHGELNPKYPGGIEAQKTHLEAEGHIILRKGRKNIRYYVKDYQDVQFDLMEEA